MRPRLSCARAAHCLITALGLALLAACGGSGGDPADIHVPSKLRFAPFTPETPWTFAPAAANQPPRVQRYPLPRVVNARGTVRYAGSCTTPGEWAFYDQVGHAIAGAPEGPRTETVTDAETGETRVTVSDPGHAGQVGSCEITARDDARGSGTVRVRIVAAGAPYRAVAFPAPRDRDFEFAVGEDVREGLPVAAGTGTVRYALSCGANDLADVGLRFVASTSSPLLIGRVTVSRTLLCTYNATDGVTSDLLTLRIRITPSDGLRFGELSVPSPWTFEPSPANQPPRAQVRELPRVVNATGDVTYSGECETPGGWALYDELAHAIVATPAGPRTTAGEDGAVTVTDPGHAGQTGLCTIDAVDEAQATGSLRLRVVAAGARYRAVVFPGPDDLEYEFDVGDDVRERLPVAAGSGAVRYALSCGSDAPAVVGLRFVAGPGTPLLIGRITASATLLCTYTATDDVTSDLVTVRIHVPSPGSLRFGELSVPSPWTFEPSATNQPPRAQVRALPRVLNATGDVSYSGECTTLGGWALYDELAHAIVATPAGPRTTAGEDGTVTVTDPGHAGQTGLCTINAVDEAGVTGRLRLRVVAAAGPYRAVAFDEGPDIEREFAVGDDVRDRLPVATGSGDIRYTLSCGADAVADIGLRFIAGPGDPLLIGRITTNRTLLCTYSATDGITSATVTVRIRIGPGSTRFRFSATVVPDRLLPVGAAVNPAIVLPRAEGGSGSIGYELDRVLPDGLCLKVSDRRGAGANPVGELSCDLTNPADSGVRRVFITAGNVANKRVYIGGRPRVSTEFVPYCLVAYNAISVTGTRAQQTWTRTNVRTEARCFELAVTERAVPRFTNVPEGPETFGIATKVDVIAPTASSGAVTATGQTLLLPVAVLPTGDTAAKYEYTLQPAIGGVGLTLTDRVLSWTATTTPPQTTLTVTHVYGVRLKDPGTGEPLAAICLDLRVVTASETVEVEIPAADDDSEPTTRTERHTTWSVRWRTRPEAVRSQGTWVCNPRPIAERSAASPSNPVHSSLSPVHGRRAVGVAHRAVAAAVRNRVASSAPRVFGGLDLSSLSGRTGGFAFSGESRAVASGASLGALDWQAGAVASFVDTELGYTAGDALSAHDYGIGSHRTEVLSVHPFVARHFGGGSYAWASVGAGSGTLTWRDDTHSASDGRWRETDVHLRSGGVGGRLPIAGVLPGAFGLEAAVSTWSFDVEALPGIIRGTETAGTDAALDARWSGADPDFTPRAALGYRYRGGDGATGGSLRLEGGLSAAFGGTFSVDVSVDAERGLAHERHERYGVGASLRYRESARRGPQVEFSSAASDLGSGTVVSRAEAGYGLARARRPWLAVEGSSDLRRVLAGFDFASLGLFKVRLEGYREDGEASSDVGARATVRGEFR